MTTNILKRLDDDLILRRLQSNEYDKLAEFNATWLSDEGPDKPEEALAVFTRELFTGTHPTFTPDLVTIVEDSKTNNIVSSCLMFPQTWSYGDATFGVGRPELIVTHPDYRRRGLVRQQMHFLHEWSQKSGNLIQAITGIPWFYRQFGYEMALDLGGGVVINIQDIPSFTADKNADFSFRPARVDDIDFIHSVYTESNQRGSLFACVRDDKAWKYEIEGHSEESSACTVITIFRSHSGNDLGFFVSPGSLSGEQYALTYLGYKESVRLENLAPSLIGALHQFGFGYAQKEQKKLEGIRLSLGANHPIYTSFPKEITNPYPPYAWYIRIPDLPAFIRAIRPTLNTRLAESDLADFSGDLTLNFYKFGLKISIAKGQVADCQPWSPFESDHSDASFPDLTFLQLVCGRRSVEEISSFFPDCSAGKPETQKLLQILFPKTRSHIWALT